MNPEKLKTICPLCKQAFALLKPEEPGEYRVKCVHCQKNIKLVLRPVEVKLQDSQYSTEEEKPKVESPDNNKTKSEKAKSEKPEMEDIPVLGKAELSNRGVYYVKEPAIVGVKSRFACPECGEHVLVNGQKEGKFYVKCNHCGTQTAVNVIEQTSSEKKKVKKKTRTVNNEIDEDRGQLVWGNFFNRKHHDLRDGVTVIGRKDEAEPSDLMLEDPTISCRSVRLEVDGKKGTCKLNVLHATNPVCVNGVAYPEGSSIFLEFNDTLKMGNTIIVYNKIKK